MTGYLVLWKGSPMQQSARSSLRKDEVGRLFVGTGYVSVWPTYKAARAAKARAVRAWGRDDGQWWSLKKLRTARAVK